MAEVEGVRLASDAHKLQHVDLEQVAIDPAAASVLPAAVARRHHVVPIGCKFGAPVVAVGDPGDVIALDTLRATLGREFVAVVADTEQIGVVLDRLYPTAATPPVVEAAPVAPTPTPAPAPRPAFAPTSTP